jgi:hypothetical protein
MFVIRTNICLFGEIHIETHCLVLEVLENLIYKTTEV